MRNIILLVVDVQMGLINKQPYNNKRVINNLKRLISTARENNVEVVYVRHDDGEG